MHIDSLIQWQWGRGEGGRSSHTIQRFDALLATEPFAPRQRDLNKLMLIRKTRSIICPRAKSRHSFQTHRPTSIPSTDGYSRCRGGWQSFAAHVPDDISVRLVRVGLPAASPPVQTVLESSR